MGNSLENFLPKSSAVVSNPLQNSIFSCHKIYKFYSPDLSVEVLVNLVSELITVLCPHLIGDEEPLKVNFFKN